MIDYQTFFASMCRVVLEAGELAKNSQAKVKNIGKEAEEVSANETVRLQAKRSAKTEIDVKVQELLIKEIINVLDPQEVLLDAEEESDSTKLFSTNPNLSTAIIIDPIDGTLEYIEGQEYYAVCVGLVEDSKMKMVLVYFPVRDILYAIDPNQKSVIVPNFSQRGYQPQPIRISSQSDKKVYKNSRVPEHIISQLTMKGFQVLDDTHQEIGCPDAILNIINGKAVAYFSEKRQMRDILLGVVIGYAENGFMSDYVGNKLEWLKKGRQPQAVFGNLAFKNQIFS